MSSAEEVKNGFVFNPTRDLALTTIANFITEGGKIRMDTREGKEEINHALACWKATVEMARAQKNLTAAQKAALVKYINFDLLAPGNHIMPSEVYFVILDELA